MKSAAQMNDFAGSAAQKLPPGRQTVPATTGAEEAMPAARTRVAADFPSSKESTPPWMMIDTTAHGAAAAAPATHVASAVAPATRRIEQVEHLISRETVLMRQSGAETLAVSLRVDSRTSLFLQLTNHHGQIQAAVRFESGDAAPWDAHWKQLQESLARQNVQLLPLEDKPSSGRPSYDTPAQTPGNFQDGPPARRSPPRPPQPDGVTPDDAMSTAAGLAQSKSNPRRYRGWEKWA